MAVWDRTYTKDAQENVGDDLKAVPVRAVLGLVQHKLSGSEGIKGLERHGCRHGTDEALPHGLVREVVRELLVPGVSLS